MSAKTAASAKATTSLSGPIASRRYPAKPKAADRGR
jgi:hypothetical protein